MQNMSIGNNGLINEGGYWIGEFIQDEHYYDAPLASSLAAFFQKEWKKGMKLCDLGCGMGDYVKYLRSKGMECDGYDGNPSTPYLSNQTCQVLNLAVPHAFEKPYSWILSLEVGEHIPPKYEQIFVNNLHLNNTQGIVLSWAIKGQPGYGHFNCQDNTYIKQIFQDLGYTNDVKAENTLRKHSSLPWFKNTLMVFRKPPQQSERKT